MHFQLLLVLSGRFGAWADSRRIWSWAEEVWEG